jgi:hypothetical protein
MVQSLASTTTPAPLSTACAPLSILRTETVLSRLPIHNLTTGGAVAIRITQTNAQGDVDLHWAVSYNEYYGPPRHLAYKLDTIVINQLLDAIPRPLPRVLKLGSLRQMGTLLDLQVSGRQYMHLKSAFHQNASAYIVAYLRYRGRDGIARTVNTGFTRYSVIFTGEILPDGTQADAVYLVLSDVYLDILNHAPVRPLDYAYLKALPPMAQRFYELLSYKMYAALKHHHPHPTLRYTDFCLLSTQQRSTVSDQVKKQMYKVHQPHVQSGYLTQAHYEGTTDAEGRPDWLIHYTPGPKARTEYAAFMRQPGAAAAAAALAIPVEHAQEDLVATITRKFPATTPPLRPEVSTPPVVAPGDTDQAVRPDPLPATTPGTAPEASREAGSPSSDAPPAEVLLTLAQALVSAFYQRFHGLAQVTASPKELDHARQLLTEHGEAKAHFLLTYAQQAAPATAYQPQVFGGILPYLPRALAAYDAQARQAAQTASQQAAAERRWHERYLAWRQHQCAQLRAALPGAELAALEDAQRAQLIANGTPAVALDLALRVAVDTVLEAQANLPTFEVWRQQQEGR